MRILMLYTLMPRLNVYLPDSIYELASRWKGTSNLSEICARAIKDELDAAEGHRSASGLLDAFRAPKEFEIALAKRFDLLDVVVTESDSAQTKLRDAVGRAAAAYLDRTLSDGAYLALAGGRQIWCTVRNLSPRRMRINITALGMHHADPVLLHVHPNTLATLLWLLYSPRSEAHLVGASSGPRWWEHEIPQKSDPSYFVISSCSPFIESSPFANLLRTETKAALRSDCASGDFAYLFFDRVGRGLRPPLDEPQITIAREILSKLAQRSDARIIMVSGGPDKIAVMRTVLESRLCNVLITDEDSARKLLE